MSKAVTKVQELISVRSRTIRGPFELREKCCLIFVHTTACKMFKVVTNLQNLILEDYDHVRYVGYMSCVIIQKQEQALRLLSPTYLTS